MDNEKQKYCLLLTHARIGNRMQVLFLYIETIRHKGPKCVLPNQFSFF